jgi:ABC-type branched-subunit amino acid transport system substrate-binding protein
VGASFGKVGNASAGIIALESSVPSSGFIAAPRLTMISPSTSASRRTRRAYSGPFSRSFLAPSIAAGTASRAAATAFFARATLRSVRDMVRYGATACTTSAAEPATT